MSENNIKKISIFKKIRNYFLAGIVVLIPIGITIYFSIFVERAFSNLLPKYLNPNNLLPIDIPGLEILITFFIITFIGMLSVTFVGKYFLNLNEKLFSKIPVLKTIFNGLTQLTKSFASVPQVREKTCTKRCFREVLTAFAINCDKKVKNKDFYGFSEFSYRFLS